MINRQVLNAGAITRRVKAHIKQARLPECRVRTRYTRLSEPIEGQSYAWQAHVLDLDSESAKVAEVLIDSLPGLLKVKRIGNSLSVIVADR